MFAPTIALLATLAGHAAQDEENPFLIDAYFAGFDALLSHPKDRGLARLAEHLPAAVRALLDPQGRESDLGVTVLEQLLSLPVRLRLSLREDPGAAMMLPFDAQLELHDMDPEVARELLDGLNEAFESDGAAPDPTVVEPGLFNRSADGVSMTYGVKDGHGILAMGPMHAPGPPETLLGAEARPLIAARFDPEQVLKMAFSNFFFFLGGEAELPNWYYALFGGMRVDAVWGQVGDDGVGILHLTEMGRVAEELGILTGATIDPASLARIPEDAAFAELWAVSPAGLFDAASLLLADAMEAEDIAAHTDTLAALAEQWFGEQGGLWLANSTGGLDGLAVVAFQELADGADVQKMFTWIGGAVPEKARVTQWQVEGTRYLSITAPGFPLPIEPTLAVRDGVLWFALQPNNLRAALSNTSSLASRVALPRDSVGWAFLDTPALAARGATWASMLASAGANTLRQYGDIEAGNWIAPVPQLLDGAKPMTVHVARRGDDLWAVVHADPSVCVNLAGVLGLVDRQLPFLAALGFGVFTAREGMMQGAIIATSRDVQVRADLRALESAILNFTLRNGEAPEDLAMLVAPDANGFRYLRSEELPLDPWGGAYHYGRDGRDATKFTLYSLGRDGAPGGEGEDADRFHDDPNLFVEDHEEMEVAADEAPVEEVEAALDVPAAAAERKVRADIRAIDQAVIGYTLRNGRAPDDLEVLVQPDENGFRFLNRTELPKDPWQRAYLYEHGEVGHQIYTLGRDGAVGGTGEDEDFFSRTEVEEGDELTPLEVAPTKPPTSPIVNARADLAAIEAAILAYQLRNGRAPDDLKVLITPDANGHTYMDGDLEDPWRNPYLYDPPSGAEKFRVYTLGRDGAPGGSGADADRSNRGRMNERNVRRRAPAPTPPPAPQKITNSTPDDQVDPGEIDLSSFTPLEKDPTCTDEEWSEIEALARILADADHPREAKQAAERLQLRGAYAYPAMVNAMLELDLETHEGHLQGDFLQKEMQRLLGGRNYGWKYDFDTEPNKTALFNKKVVRNYYKTWSKVSGSYFEWKRLSKAPWAPPPRPQEVDEAKLSNLDRARRRRASADLLAIDAALLHYAVNNGGRFPADLGVLVAPDANGEAYLDLPSIPEDPWERKYLYLPPTEQRGHLVFTFGANGVQGGEGADADLTHESARD